MATEPLKGLVLNIQHFCTDDGPGIRTTVFLKFCSLHCKWCSNPESIGPKPELAYNANKCIGAKACGRCLKAPAPEGAMYVVDGPDDRVRINWALAADCGEETTELCPSEALYLFGTRMTVDQVLEEVEQDSAFIATPAEGSRSRAANACFSQTSARRCSPRPATAGSRPRSRPRATCRGSSWRRCCRTSTL